eukprot:5806214-Prymnesium_polylepis.1
MSNDGLTAKDGRVAANLTAEAPPRLYEQLASQGLDEMELAARPKRQREVVIKKFDSLGYDHTASCALNLFASMT